MPRAGRRVDFPLRRKTNVVLYEPSGRGGICHYTYQLAGALVARGCGVTVATPEKYELGHLPRRFGYLALFRPSRVKRLLSLVFPSLRRVGGGEGRDTAGSSGRGEGLGSVLRAWRLRLIFTGLVLRILRRRPDVVHLQSVKGGRDLVLVRMLKRLRFRMVYTAHDLLPHDSESAADERTLAETCRMVDLVDCARREEPRGIDLALPSRADEDRLHSAWELRFLFPRAEGRPQ